MRFKEKIPYLFISLLIISSCSSLRNIPIHPNRVSLVDSSLYLLGGKFKSQPFHADSSVRGDLSWYLFDRGYNPKTKLDFVEIKVKKNNKLEVLHWDSTTLIKSNTFKGKIESGYFVFKRRYLIIPAILVNVFRGRSLRICLLPNGNLLADYKQISIGSFYVILPDFSKQKEYAVEFERLN